MKNSKRVLYVLVCVAAVAAFCVGGLRMSAEKAFYASAQPADAFIDDVVQTTDELGNKRTVVTVWYLVDGVEYVCELAGYTPEMKDADGKIAVYYLPDEPSYCRAPASDSYTGMFWLGGALTCAAVIWSFWKNPFRAAQKTREQA